MTRKKAVDVKSWLAFLQGIVIATDVVYLFAVGTTYFLISEVFSLGLFLYLLFTKQIQKNQIRICFDNWLLLYLVYIFFSSLIAFARFLSVSLMYRYVVGVIMLVISLTSLINVVILFEKKEFIIKGIGLGIVLNFLFVAIDYLFWQSSSTPFMLLYNMFKQPNFARSIYGFQAQGLFLEASHMIHYMASCLPIWIAYNSGVSLKGILVLMMAIISVALTGSGTSAIIAVSLLLLVILYAKRIRYVKKQTLIIVMALIPIGFLLLFVTMGTTSGRTLIDTAVKYVQHAAEGSRVTDSSNAERLNNMLEAIRLIKRNPVGCGWNMSHTLFEQQSSLRVHAAFSDILEMTMELGIGILFYFAFVLSTFISLLRIGTREAKGVAVAVLSVFIMQCLADYSFGPGMMLVFGFARAIILEAQNVIDLQN